MTSLTPTSSFGSGESSISHPTGSPTYTTYVLNTEAINQQYEVTYWTAPNGDHNVLAVDRVTDSSPSLYGVVLSQSRVTLENTASVTEVYAVKYNVKLAGGSTQDFIGINPSNNKPFTASDLDTEGAKADSTSTVNLVRQLVKITPVANSDWYTLTAAKSNLNDKGDITYAGDSDTILSSGSRNILVNDNTVFFVADYKMQNSNSNSNPISYETNGYSIYEGFKKLPSDMTYVNSKIYENGTEVKEPLI